MPVRSARAVTPVCAPLLLPGQLGSSATACEQPFAVAGDHGGDFRRLVGPEYVPPVLHSLAAALQNHGYDANPATSDLHSDRTRRDFQAVLGEIPKTWKLGLRNDAARSELVRTLREVSEIDAGRAVIDLLKHGVSADSI